MEKASGMQREEEEAFFVVFPLGIGGGLNLTHGHFSIKSAYRYLVHEKVEEKENQRSVMPPTEIITENILEVSKKLHECVFLDTYRSTVQVLPTSKTKRENGL
ncbi:hypothetical protein VNO77_43043 [Canavalia gladiata]|uniref:Uncharacterized protein n=1 Tax=Canavalia gladiata TaxID=3824 RepID=A0AAN9JVS6_CANGL